MTKTPDADTTITVELAYYAVRNAALETALDEASAKLEQAAEIIDGHDMPALSSIFRAAATDASSVCQGLAKRTAPRAPMTCRCPTSAPSNKGDYSMDDNFRAELESAINRHSMENGSDTPDFLLAQFLADCLTAYDKTVTAREKWYGRGLPKIETGAEDEPA